MDFTFFNDEWNQSNEVTIDTNRTPFEQSEQSWMKKRYEK